ncbi:MAG: zinc ribbon domain-containing protein [Spirochaetia bacterium]|nr:zinc ribbon domain-containing protein [Spirochaetia bacterium]MDD7612553.1 zinc ribbon domain-containing protein [Spirochaetales bacterium]MDY5915770.1 zinc ribbon domain-containing protein [Treponema sp.]
MKKTDKEAKFFCESCGSEVPRKSRFCPVCGKFFASVRCPKCGHTGASEDFKSGCPECGYAVNSNGSLSQNQNSDNSSQNNIKYKNKIASKKLKKNNKSGQDGSLPVWIYIISVLVLIILIICLYSCL